jgi:GTP-binding protein
MLLDELRIQVISGKGGDGAVSFRREKFVPYGGPDGGNGGKGGSVILEVNENYNTLLDLGEDRTFRAEDGVNGAKSRAAGRTGKDRVIYVPRGTLVRDAMGNLLADLTTTGQRWVAAEGGRGGRGNYTFRSSINQVPYFNTKGGDAIEAELYLELKLMADVGLVGFPNAGKSSLVNRISSGRPKVGDYPFTTLEPVLGIVQMSDYGSFVIADIPGLLEGAAEGRGLGHQFLKHIERTTTLLFVIDGFEEDAWEKYEILQKELEAFHPSMLDKQQVVALNKADLGIEENLQKFRDNKVKVFPVSAVDGKGTKALVRELEQYVRPSHMNYAW